jgi:hypothetical protein
MQIAARKRRKKFYSARQIPPVVILSKQPI